MAGTWHADIYLVMAEQEIFLGHGQVDGKPVSKKRMYDVANLLHKCAWDIEDLAEQQPDDKDEEADHG